MQCPARMTIFQSKQAQEYCIKCKCEPASWKILDLKLSHWSPLNEILYLQHWRLFSDKSVCLSLYFTTNLKKNTSIFTQATLIDSPPHYSPQLFYDHFQSIQFQFSCNVTNGSRFKIRGYHLAQYTVTFSCDTMASALLQVYQHFGIKYCLHLRSILLWNAEKLSTAYHIIQPSPWRSAKSHLKSHSYCLMTTKCCCCNWQHLLPGHLGYDTRLQSRFAVSLPISPQHGSWPPWTPHILQKWVKLLPIVRKVRVQNSVNNCQHTLRSNSKDRCPYLHGHESWNLTS
jgi:hypothetical protein